MEATGRSGLELVVEESGWVEKLALLVRDDGAGYFDTFHLTGHVTSEGKEPKEKPVPSFAFPLQS